MTAGTQCSDLALAAAYSRVDRRNNSLSTRGRLLVFAFLFVVSFGIAAAFAILGAWLILPFAGLEMLVLFFAFRCMDRHAGDYERISICGDKVEVEICESGRARFHEASRYWTRVVRQAPARVALRSHGREIEIGRHLNEEQRLELAAELGRQLRGAR